MSLLVEMWSKDSNVESKIRWPWCRRYPTLDAPMLAKVTRILNDPSTGIKRAFTSHEYIINPRDIEQRNTDRKLGKFVSIIILGIVLGIFIFYFCQKHEEF